MGLRLVKLWLQSALGYELRFRSKENLFFLISAFYFDEPKRAQPVHDQTL